MLQMNVHGVGNMLASPVGSGKLARRLYQVGVCVREQQKQDARWVQDTRIQPKIRKPVVTTRGTGGGGSEEV
jgi:hypothetical protein